MSKNKVNLACRGLNARYKQLKLTAKAAIEFVWTSIYWELSRSKTLYAHVEQ